MRDKWPASPEYYDSAIMVNGDGENVLNYRKRFLYKTDETWALEGDGGFHQAEIPGLGKTVVGMCMDLNPYRFESPWNAFEFGFHALEVEPDLVIVNMSWVTRQDHREFSRMLAEPDMETLTYWVQRLEPLISAELEKEIIVVFCNRCGQEDEALYAGTSAIIGIKGGEVNVYALAGRGTKEFLMADTNNPPFAKLVQSVDEQEIEGVAASTTNTLKTSPGLSRPAATPAPPPARSATANVTASNIQPASSIAPPRGGPPPPPIVTNTAMLPGNSIAPPRGGQPTPKRERPSPKIQIPDFGTHPFSSPSSSSRSRPGTVPESPVTIPTPEAPSPTPLAIRPKLIIPETASAFGDFRKPSPYPHDDFLLRQHRFFGRHSQALTPVPPEQDPAQARYYWRPSDTLLNAPFNMNWASSPDSDNGPKVNDLGPLTPYPGSDIPNLSRTAKHNAKAKDAAKAKPAMSGRPEPSPEHTRTNSNSSSTETSRKVAQPQRASSPKQRSAKPRNEPRSNSKAAPKQSSNSPPRREWAATPVDRVGSVADTRPSWMDNVRNVERVKERPESPKARHTSRSRARAGSGAVEHGGYVRRGSDAPVNGVQSVRTRTRSGSSRPPSRRGRTSQDGDDIDRPGSRAAKHVVNGDEPARPESRATTRQLVNGDAGGLTRTSSVIKHSTEKSNPEMAGVTLPKLAMRAQSPGGRFDETRPISRGRQRWLARDPPPPYSETENNRLVQAAVVQPQAQPQPQQQQATNTPPMPRQVSITRMQSASGLAGVRFATPDDEIVAIEEYIDPICNMHSKRAASTSAISHRIPSIADGRAIVGMLAGLPPPPPVPVLGLDDGSDNRGVTVFRTPSVLGGSIKTTIIDVPHSRTESGVSVMTPPLSAISARSGFMSPTSPTTNATSDNNTPSTPKFDLTPRAMAIAQFTHAAKRIDTPFPPLACIHCTHEKHVVEPPLKTGPLERVKDVEGDHPRPRPFGSAVADSLPKRSSW
ncbi:hypothetical protein GE09DRAFT_211311 [Coniochaeta sp. 2T2.1]|nr:hypothetical protein GE09DRAFT_211311 [Coniochaeta sp. 2T2.1]